MIPPRAESPTAGRCGRPRTRKAVRLDDLPRNRKYPYSERRLLGTMFRNWATWTAVVGGFPFLCLFPLSHLTNGSNLSGGEPPPPAGFFFFWGPSSAPKLCVSAQALRRSRTQLDRRVLHP